MRKYLFIIFAVAIVVRIFLLATDEITPLQKDAKNNYYEPAGKIVETGFIKFIKSPPPDTGPVYPLFLASIFKVFGVGQRQVYIIQVLLDLISIYLVYLMGKLVSEEKVGVLAAGLYSLNPATLAFSRCVLTESLMVFWVSLFFALVFLAVEKRKVWIFFLAGIVGILGGLTRMVFMGFPVICAVWILVYFWKERTDALKFAGAFSILYLVGTGAFIVKFGSYPMKMALHLLKRNIDLGPSHLYKNVLALWEGPMVRQVILQKGDQVIWREGIVSSLLTFPLFLFVIASAFFSALFVRLNKRYVLLYLFLLYWTLIHAFTLSIRRYQVPALPVVIVVFSVFFFRYLEIRKKCGKGDEKIKDGNWEDSLD